MNTQMNDRFIFRAWSKQLQRYCNIDEMNVSSLAEINSDLIIEQCTGLKDKNGKLIYENDYVKIDSSTININETEAVVFWDNDEASFNLRWLPKGSGAQAIKRIKKLSKHGIGDIRWWEVEVIGNIHENPELLEDK